MLEDPLEALAADGAKPDMFVPIDARSAAFFAVVQMQGANRFEHAMFLGIFLPSLESAETRKIITCRMRMAGIETDPDPHRLAGPLEHPSELFHAPAQTRPLSSGVLEQQPRVLSADLLGYLGHPIDDPLHP